VNINKDQSMVIWLKFTVENKLVAGFC